MRLALACVLLAACSGSTSPTLTDALHPRDDSGADAPLQELDAAVASDGGEDAASEGAAADGGTEAAGVNEGGDAGGAQDAAPEAEGGGGGCHNGCCPVDRSDCLEVDQYRPSTGPIPDPTYSACPSGVATCVKEGYAELYSCTIYQALSDYTQAVNNETLPKCASSPPTVPPTCYTASAQVLCVYELVRGCWPDGGGGGLPVDAGCR